MWGGTEVGVCANGLCERGGWCNPREIVAGVRVRAAKTLQYPVLIRYAIGKKLCQQNLRGDGVSYPLKRNFECLLSGESDEKYPRIHSAPSVKSHTTTKVFGGQTPVLVPTVGTYAVCVS